MGSIYPRVISTLFTTVQAMKATMKPMIVYFIIDLDLEIRSDLPTAKIYINPANMRARVAATAATLIKNSTVSWPIKTIEQRVHSLHSSQGVFGSFIFLPQGMKPAEPEIWLQVAVAVPGAFPSLG